MDYSPELNPDEILNQDVKSNAVGRKRSHSKEELIKNVRSYLKSRQRKPNIVKKYFKEKNVHSVSLILRGGASWPGILSRSLGTRTRKNYVDAIMRVFIM